MRPLRLALEGFTVFRERQEVDFEPLELFVITGPTGAGKTSILDAITFALYGRLPRFAGAQGTSDAVSLGLVRATVELEFSIHNRGRYRIVRRMSRRANQPQTLVFERLDGGTWVPACDGRVRESNKRIAEVVGLDFDAFTRAVLLPQGEFHRFLKGEAGERRRILVSLLGVSYFEAMAGIARRRSAELRARVQRTDELLAEQYADATPEHVEELRAGARAAADQAKAIAQSVENAAAEGTRAAEATTRARAIQAARAQLEALAADLGRLADTAAAAEGEAAATQNRLDAKAAEVDRARAAVSDAQQRERLIEAEVGTLVELARAAAAAQTLSEAAERQEQARLELEAAAEEVAAAQRELSDAQAAHESVSMRLAGASEQAASALAEADSAREGHQQLAAALAAAELAEADLAGAERELVVHAEALQRARAEAERARDALSEATAELEEHRRMHAVAELSSGLSAGDPCPVCGAVLAAAIPVAPDVATALQSARTREEQARAREGAAGQALARAEAELAALEQKRASCAERLSQALAGHADTAALAGAAAAAEAAAAQRAARAAELTGQLEALEREREQLSRRVA
ncbi:MAG TPA: SMC family ATPase, partial [Solirubrobacteraceae bacterium]|nr:SMC family ATPase [Solirubrobacteraceae bacterium]